MYKDVFPIEVIFESFEGEVVSRLVFYTCGIRGACNILAGFDENTFWDARGPDL